MYIYFKDSDIFNYVKVKLKYRKNFIIKKTINVEPNKSYFFDKEIKNMNIEISFKNGNKYELLQAIHFSNIDNDNYRKHINDQFELENLCGKDELDAFIANDNFKSVKFNFERNTIVDIKSLNLIEIYDDSNNLISIRNNRMAHNYVRTLNYIFLFIVLLVLLYIYIF